MDPHLVEWLNLALRWAHVITGIAWIGSSFYFMWLDAHLTKPEPQRQNVDGEIWLVHSGGFYLTEKRKLEARQVPENLQWFKWEAAYTLITGLLLLCIVYYTAANTYMIDLTKADLSPDLAITLGVATLVIGWLLYDGLWISPLASHEKTLNVICFLLLGGIAWGLSQLISGRAAFMHVGALMGLIMAVNVWVRILPAQTAMIAATQKGNPVDWGLGAKAKHRSVHNNYMTLPVVFVMLSSHYPSTYGHPHGWLVLMGLFVIGGAIRHWFNLRNRGKQNKWIIPAAVAGGIGLFWYTGQPSVSAITTDGPPIAFAEVRNVIALRCQACHSATPTHPGFNKPPKNVILDTPAQIRAQAQPIHQQTVMTRVMPLGNVTQITDDERDLIARWVAQGAPLK
jgi:uncharacterized membrane protein